MALECSAGGLSSNPKHKKAGMCLTEKVCQVGFVQAGVTLLLAMSSMLMNQHYLLNKMFLSRSTHKTKLFIDRLVKIW